MNGGPDCPGPSEDSRECDTGVPCPQHGEWGMWSYWSGCTVSCGVGDEFRVRLCDNPPPLHGGMQCKGFAEEMRHCDTKVPCPIDGHWSPWTGFSHCSVSCGMGESLRERYCDSPAPQFGGRPCDGPNHELTGCLTDISCPIDGNWGPWYDWSKCNGICGMGKMKRKRECNNPPNQFGGVPCVGPGTEIGHCDTGVPCPIDGNWGHWSHFTQCSALCGMGSQERTRKCNDPVPQFGGNQCPGIHTEVSECDTFIPCKIDGGWGPWGRWEECPVNCGVGLAIRRRVCDSPAPQYGGIYCQGPDVEENKCDTFKPCVQHGGWSFWSEWTKCSALCGKGKMKRYRECTNPEPLYGGLLCQGPTSEITDCDSGMACPIDGNWGPWFDWSKCSASCGVGVMERKRVCNNPPPQHGGLPCQGKLADVAECDTQIPCPVHGGFTLWSPWSLCSARCGIGIKVRTRDCKNPPPAFGGNMCIGVYEEVVDCDSGVYCPINGGWSHWTEFSACMGECGYGEKTRVRVCDNPVPQNGGLSCDGPNIEVFKCEAALPCPVDGGWTFWSEWTYCDAKCGKGISERVRKCANPEPMHGGKPCIGPHIEIIDCDSGNPCEIDGHWTPWSQWSACSDDCDSGTQVRYRTCSNPRPSINGKLCSGMPEETRECTSGRHCPVNGNWAFWSDWSHCDATCGKGFHTRFRLCMDPKPMYGGKVCFGDSQEKRVCDSGVPCAIPGNWSPWSEWDECSGKCGPGTETRYRSCTNPLPQFGGPPCEGFSEETRYCDGGQWCVTDGEWGSWLQWEDCLADCGIGIRRRWVVGTFYNFKPKGILFSII